MTSASDSIWIAMMDHMFNFWSHCHSPQDFLKWICTCSKSQRRCSIRFPDDWWTRFIGSQLLYSLRDNCITLRGNWLLCYGMHQGELNDLPGAPKPFANSDRTHLIWWKARRLFRRNGKLLSCPHWPSLLCKPWHRNEDYNKSGPSICCTSEKERF